MLHVAHYGTLESPSSHMATSQEAALRFTLEALQAQHGDSLLAHWGTAAEPRLMLIDGGPDPTYRTTLKDRLVRLAARRPDQKLVLDLVMISHIDDDHINGVQDLLTDLDRGRLAQIDVNRFWFNSFDDLVALDAGFVAADQQPGLSLTTARRHATGAAAAVMASVPQGKKVAVLATRLGLDGNPPFNGLVVAPRKAARTVSVGNQLELTIVGPNRARVEQLREEWTAAAGLASPTALAYVDDSVANLSSIVVVAKGAGRTMLLTGDARGDDVISGLRAGRLLDAAGRIHVDLLKLPHHGSDRNVETEFFRTVTADHYVVSGDGSESNPELATLAMLTEARGASPYTIHFTNREPRVQRWFARNRKPTDRYEVRYRRANRPSITVDLADPLR